MGVLCFNRRWGGGVGGRVFFTWGWGFIFKWGGSTHRRASVLVVVVVGGFKKNHKMGGTPSPITMGNPDTGR